MSNCAVGAGSVRNADCKTYGVARSESPSEIVVAPTHMSVLEPGSGIFVSETDALITAYVTEALAATGTKPLPPPLPRSRAPKGSQRIVTIHDVDKSQDDGFEDEVTVECVRPFDRWE